MTNFLTIVASLTALGTAVAAQAAPVEIDLTGLRAGGRLYVQLQTRDQYMGQARAAGRIVEAPAAGSLGLNFDVPPGDYAATVWHDDDGNNRFDVDPATGRPLDGWATINADKLHAAPTFDDVKLAVTAAGAKVPLALRYGR
jgi:uncharacterized protein (DUF2141 family)